MSLRKLLLLTLCCVAVVAFALPANASLIVSGVMDGTLTGGKPKAIELHALAAIPDLSKYGIARSSGTNPGGFDAIFPLPAVSLNAGDFWYAVGNGFGDQTPEFDLVFPGKTTIRSQNDGVNSNGNDATGLFFSADGSFGVGTVLHDIAGDQNGDPFTDTPPGAAAWRHNDSYMYSKNGRAPNGGVFNPANWILPGPDLLDFMTAAQMNAAVPFMTHSLVVPEPASIALMIAGLLGLGGMRRRWG